MSAQSGLTPNKPSNAKALILTAMNANRPVFLWGPPGIGKSDLIASIGKQQNRPVIDMRMLLMDPTDIKGIPYFCPVRNEMHWAKPGELPAITTQADIDDLAKDVSDCKVVMGNLTAENGDVYFTAKKNLKMAEQRLSAAQNAFAFNSAILFLDEMNAAPQSVQAAAYQLILNRRVGEYQLPDGISIIAAGNRETDKGVTFQMPKPLANRFFHVEMKEHYEDFQHWAVMNKVDSRVLGYLESNKQHLFQFDPKSPEKAFATPRSWHACSDLLYSAEETHLPESLLTSLVGGIIGPGLAANFMAHVRFADKLPKPEDVWNNKAKELTQKETSACYTLAISLCYMMKDQMDRSKDANDKSVTEQSYCTGVNNVLEYCMKYFSKEMNVLLLTTAFRVYKITFSPQLVPAMTKFAKEYKEFIFDN